MQPQPYPAPRKRRSGPPTALLGLLGMLVIAGICLIGVVVVMDVGGDDDQTPASAPTYRVVSQNAKGEIVVEVDALVTKEQMQAIAEDLRTKQTKDHGYWVSINCSTGGTKAADNRLGNARFGLGALGTAQTGVEKGKVLVEPNEGRTCPAK